MVVVSGVTVTMVMVVTGVVVVMMVLTVMVVVTVMMVVTVMIVVVVVTVIEVIVVVGLMGVWVSGGGTVYPEANSPPRSSGAGCSGQKQKVALS